MTHIVVIGCGVVGAAIAYELSRIPALDITVIDQNSPAQASTGAALGVLMGIISQKTKGKAWNLRQTSIRRYGTLIPELEALGHSVPWNPQGVLRLNFIDEDLSHWESLIAIRHAQGWRLEQWDRQTLAARCPDIENDRLVGAIYSPQDLQIDPTALTLALVAAAQSRGVQFQFDNPVRRLPSAPGQPVETSRGAIAADWVVVATGLGTTGLTAELVKPVDIRPVLGQALRLKLDTPLSAFQPATNGEDIHLVPLTGGEYWIGATVEFPDAAGTVLASAAQLEDVKAKAIALCPAMANSTVLQTWSGLRPRPYNRPAPIIEPLSEGIFLATGHYRNGVLLAPATALAVTAAACERFGVSPN
jgi:glycine/D-amino acid oxidase-like deaminating enzyme